MKVLVVGAGGQLGRELQQTLPPGIEALWLTREDLDLTDREAVLSRVRERGPTHIIDAAAYTAVDRAESEPERAYAINAHGAAHLAEAAAASGARLVYVSTDFVFDGSQSRPYAPTARPNPLGVYGASKAAGEQKVLEWVPDALVVRTAWLYSAQGGNFVKTMLRLLAERDSIGVVDDQVGSPTWARGLAEALWALLAADARGIHHWTDAGVASWYDFAVAIGEEGRRLGLLSRPAQVLPIGTDEFPTAARRPAFSVLDKADTWRFLGRKGMHWRAALRGMLEELATADNGAGAHHA